MLNELQRQCLLNIEGLVNEIRHLDTPDVPPPPPGPSVITLQEGQNAQTVVNNAPEEAIVDLGGLQINVSAGTNFVIPKPLTIRNGVIAALQGVNDIVDVRGSGVRFYDLMIRGFGDTKRGIVINGADFLAERIEVRNIRRSGQESNAVATWSSPGPITIRDSVLEGASQSFLAGGSTPAVPNTVPTGLLFERVTFTRPLEWDGQGYAIKTAFELKAGRNVVVRECILENVPVDGQNGFAVTLTPVHYGGQSPDTQVANVLFENNIIRNCGSGLNLLGFTQETNPTLQTVGVYFRNNSFELSRALYGGHGVLMQLARNPRDIEWTGNMVTADGDAFIRVSDSQQVLEFSFENNVVNVPGTYGVFTPVGSRGVNFGQIFPSGIIVGNTFTSANSTFRTNFPSNTYA